MSRPTLHILQLKGAKMLRALRRQSGDILIDSLVSVLVSALLGSALVQMYAQVHKVGNQSQAQFVAASVAQEAIDHLRSLPYSMVFNNIGVHTPQVNGTGNGDVLFPRALLQDSSSYVGAGGSSTSLDYSGQCDSFVSQGLGNVLQTCDATGTKTNTITVNIVPLSSGGSSGLQVTVTVYFVDGSPTCRKYTISSMLTNNGLNG